MAQAQPLADQPQAHSVQGGGECEQLWPDQPAAGPGKEEGRPLLCGAAAVRSREERAKSQLVFLSFCTNVSCVVTLRCLFLLIYANHTVIYK